MDLAGVVEDQLLAITVDALKFAKTGDDVGFQINRTITRRTDEARGSSATPSIDLERKEVSST